MNVSLAAYISMQMSEYELDCESVWGYECECGYDCKCEYKHECKQEFVCEFNL